MSTELFRKYIDIINENSQTNELSANLMRKAFNAAEKKVSSLTGPADYAARNKAADQSDKFYQSQIGKSEKNPEEGNFATFNAYKEKLEQKGWTPIDDPEEAQEVLAKLRITEPGSIAYTAQSGEVAGLSPSGRLRRTRGTMVGSQRFGSDMHPSVPADRKWNIGGDDDMFDPKSSF